MPRYKQIVEVTEFEKDTGEIVRTEVRKTKTQEREPDFVKLYLKTFLTFSKLPQSISPILFELLQYMTYANDPKGGQIIYLNIEIKKNIAKSLGISLIRINNVIVSLSKNNILQRIGTGSYRVNPDLIGKGEWKDVLKVKGAYFDFELNKVEPNITYTDHSKSE